MASLLGHSQLRKQHWADEGKYKLPLIFVVSPQFWK
jgi:hypothetical protein